jgi:predicted transcriptional regulator
MEDQDRAMTLFNLQIDETTASRLGQLAKQRQLSAEEIAALAIEEYVSREEWQVAEIEAALREAEAGDFASEEDIAAVLERHAARAR